MLPALAVPATDDLTSLRRQVDGWRAQGLTIGFVPTMGALHAGHVSLIETAMAQADRVIVSIFVNPMQFAAGEDLETYPRTLEADSLMLAAAGCHLLYAPPPETMYPQGFSSAVQVEGPATGLETEARPHFFEGVATVVLKLFNRVRPDIAVFGEKDYQQLLVIRRMVEDLDLPIRVVAGETLREPDGLAMSSRNAYLSAPERIKAGRLNVILRDLAHAIGDGEPVADALHHATEIAAHVFDDIDYLEVRDAETLYELGGGPLDGPARVLAAVRVGKTRLIDNMGAAPDR
ncbi:pantoate--beta-alanine ligase [Glycocaulis profundi]|nr:pantoate--beta-alanine ligase [Glycocaulis profundi]